MKTISIEAYNKKMDKIIKKHKDIDKCLIALLNEASKYKIRRKI